MTVQFLNVVLNVCQNAGLKVVATVCDMGDISVKALKLFCAPSRKPSFMFSNLSHYQYVGQEI
jgi:hypothetical protein